MANIYRRGRVWWIRYRHQGRRVQHSLDTTRRRTAERKCRQIEYELETGCLQQPSRTPLGPTVSTFCQKLMATEPPKAWRTDLSYLRAFFGPICEELRPDERHGRWRDPLSGRHVRCNHLEELTPAMIAGFLHGRLTRQVMMMAFCTVGNRLEDGKVVGEGPFGGVSESEALEAFADQNYLKAAERLEALKQRKVTAMNRIPRSPS